MAQYWEDWSGSTVGQEPTGWTKRFVTTNVTYTVGEDAEGPAGRRLRIARTANGRSGISWDALDSDGARDRIEMRALVRFAGDTGGASQAFNGCMARGAGAAGSETMVVSWIGKSSGAKRGLRNSQYVSGSLTTLDAPNVDHWDVGTLYWLGMSAVGGSLTCTLALALDPDTPIATLASTTAVTDPGFAGFYSFSPYITVDVLALGVGTGGDAAPTSAPSGGTHLIEGAAAVSVHASGDLTTAPANAVKGVRVQLGAGAESLTGLLVRYWDDPEASGAPDYEADNGTTDANRYIELDLDAITAHAIDGVGSLRVIKQGATPADDIEAGGRVQIVNIAP